MTDVPLNSAPPIDESTSEYVGVVDVPKPMNTDTARIIAWIFLGLFIFAIILLIGFGIYWWAFRTTAPATNCRSVADCSAGYYCSHSSICIPGGGATEGQPCATNDSCVVGLYCNTGICSMDAAPPPTPDHDVISTPASFSLYTYINNQIYQVYLNNDGGFLIPKSCTDNENPKYYFEYKSTTKTLEWIACDDPTNPFSVGIEGNTATYNGSPFAANGNSGELFYLQGSQQNCFIRHPCGDIFTTLQRSTQTVTVTLNPLGSVTVQGYNIFFPNIDKAHCSTYPSGNTENIVSFQLVDYTCP